MAALNSVAILNQLRFLEVLFGRSPDAAAADVVDSSSSSWSFFASCRLMSVSNVILHPPSNVTKLTGSFILRMF